VLKVFIRYTIYLFLVQILYPVNLLGQEVPKSGNSDSIPPVDTSAWTYTKLDSSNIKPDTTKSTPSSTLSSPVDYQSADTIESFLNEKRIILKGDAKVLYGDIELTASYIDIDFNKNEIFAKGKTDSLGNEIGLPIFKEGEDLYESREIRYNFKTKKGIITDVVTEQDGGFLHSRRTKKHTENIIDLKAGKYTTCDHEHPHYYIAMSKARVIQNDKIVSGPLYLVIEDVPTPIAIPFGFFPFTKEKTSGLILPRYGESERRGFSLEDLGYYWALSDYMDLKVVGSIYSKGSYKGTISSRYKKRYRYSGQLSFMLEKIIESERGLADYVNTDAYNLTWHHNQDPKARPNSNFSANVNLKSTSANRYSTQMNNYLQNTVNSSVNYSHSLPGTPFSFNAQLRHTLNTKDSSVAMTLPSVNLNMQRITPFAPKNSNKPPNLLQKIGITYSSRLENRFTVKEDELFKKDVVDEFKFGVKHDVGVKTSAKFLKFLNFSPSANYTERWYFNSLRKKYEGSLFTEGDTVFGKTTTDTITGFNRIYDYNVSAGVNTTLYGLYTFQSYIPVEAIRFVHSPSVSYSYRPNFSLDKYGYYDEVEGQPNQTYSYYDNGIYGVPSGPRSGAINLSLGNQVSMKVRTPNDSVSKTKKIDLLKTLNFSTNYNIVADSMNWSPLSMRASTNLFQKVNVQFNATMDPYALDPITYKRIDKYQFNVDGKLGRITRAAVSFNFKLDSKMFEGDEVSEEEQQRAVVDYYDYFDIPWSFTLNYKYTFSKPQNTKSVIQTVGLRGNFSVTDKWKVGFRTGYDFERRKMSATTLDITRDLHCWVMSFHWVPFGERQSYSFTIGVKSSILQDLKYDKRENWYDNGQY